MRFFKCFITMIFTIICFNVFTSCNSTKVSKNQNGVIQGDTIVLQGNPTTGYTWGYTESVKGIVSIEETQTYLGGKDLVGAPSLFKYKVKPVKDGNLVLIFMYKRNWEKDSPLEARMFYVEVKGSKVTITEE